MSDAEIAELAADIAAHGMHKPMVLWRDNREQANGSEGPFPVYLLDGRNRLAALSLLGIDDPFRAQYGDLSINTVITLRALKEVFGLSLSNGKTKGRWEVDCDPYAFYQSMNVFRRHLTPEQRRWMVKQAIARDPKANDSEISRQTNVSDKTVATVRAEMATAPRKPETPKIEGENRPLERAKRAFKENPSASLSQIAKQERVSTFLFASLWWVLTYARS
jgi:hypothetical protein